MTYEWLLNYNFKFQLVSELNETTFPNGSSIAPFRNGLGAMLDGKNKFQLCVKD